MKAESPNLLTLLQAGPEAAPAGESEQERLQVLEYVGVGAVLVGLAVTGVGAPPARQHWPYILMLPCSGIGHRGFVSTPLRLAGPGLVVAGCLLIVIR